MQNHLPVRVTGSSRFALAFSVDCLPSPVTGPTPHRNVLLIGNWTGCCWKICLEMVLQITVGVCRRFHGQSLQNGKF